MAALRSTGLVALVCWSFACSGPTRDSEPSFNPRRPLLLVEVAPQPLAAAHLFSLAGDLRQLSYHVSIRNTSGSVVELERLAVQLLKEGQPLLRQELSVALLRQRLRPVPWISVRDRQSLAAALRWQGTLARPRGDSRLGPTDSASLPHQVLWLRPGEDPDLLTVSLELVGGARLVRSFPVRSFRQLTALRLPVSGRWWVMQGHRFDEEHAGGALSSQSFAYDLGVIGDQGRTYRGDPLRNSSYLAYGQPVQAMADGEVVRVQDGISDNSPVGQRPSAEQVLRRPEELAGNFVIIRHRGNEHSAYLHLQRGLLVAVGARVSAGQRIGRCGNSGNSLEPHLHVQLQNGPDFLQAAGLPAGFSDFTLELGHVALHVAGPRPLPGQLPVQSGRAAGAAELDPLPRR